MLAKLRRVWLKWRENRRQRAIDLYLYRSSRGRSPGDDLAHHEIEQLVAVRATPLRRRPAPPRAAKATALNRPALDASRAASVPPQRAA